MKTTINVSIGGYPFRLEDDAYRKLNEYLTAVKLHFRHKEEGAEIAADLETRVSELLRLKSKENPDAVISIEDILELIKMLGSPKEMDDSTYEQLENSEPKQEQEPIKKKLFRDKQHAVFGGVCSGLGHYFGLDPVIIRAALVLIVALGIFTGFASFFGIAVLYLILWLIIPQPQSMEEFTQMLGKSPSITNIENRENVTFYKERSSGLLKVIKIFFGIILAIISFKLLLLIVITIAAFWGAATYIDIPGVGFVMSAFSFGSTSLKTGMLLSILLPLIGLFYWTIKLLFQSRFTKMDLFISIAATISWIAISCYVGAYVASYFSNINYSARETVEREVPTNSKSIFIKIDSGAEYKKSLNFGHRNERIYFFTKNNEQFLVMNPWVRIEEDSNLLDYKIVFEKKALGDSYESAKNKVEEFTPEYKITDSLITIKPIVFSDSSPWDYTSYNVKVYVPKGKKAVISKSNKISL